MKVIYLDLIGGASGDMILGAMMDAGLKEEDLCHQLDKLHLSGWELQVKTVVKNGFSAKKVNVTINDDVHERHLSEINEIIDQSELSLEIKNHAKSIFYRIAEIEAGIHSIPIGKVHLHEVGGLDTIIDITSTLIALDLLGIETLYASEVPLGHGFVQGAHGQIPIPAPATVALLQGIPVLGREIDAELVTPTGAALLSNLVNHFGPLPPMEFQAIGYGAGERDLPFPNLLRVFVGEQHAPVHSNEEILTVLETNIDDLNPEIYPHLMDQLFQYGALDVIYHPIHMKKNRPAIQLQVLCEPSDISKMEKLIFQETSTLGIRCRRVVRHSLPRSLHQVETQYGTVHVKVAQFGQDQVKISPEYEDCRILAEKHNVPLQKIYDLAKQAYNSGT